MNTADQKQELFTTIHDAGRWVQVLEKLYSVDWQKRGETYVTASHVLQGGGRHKKGCTAFSAKYGWTVFDGGERNSIIDEVIKRHGGDFLSALQWIAEAAGVEFSTANKQQWAERQHKREQHKTLLGRIADGFANSPAVEYLRAARPNGRGWSVEDVELSCKAPEHGGGFVGYLTAEILKELQTAGGFKFPARAAQNISDFVAYIDTDHGGLIANIKLRSRTGHEFYNICGAIPCCFNMYGIRPFGGCSEQYDDFGLILCEGEADALAVKQALSNYPNVVAARGNKNHETLLPAVQMWAEARTPQNRLYTLFTDNDTAGREMVRNVGRMVAQAGGTLFVVYWGTIQAKDADELAHDGQHGAQYVRELLNRALPVAEYYRQQAFDLWSAPADTPRSEELKKHTAAETLAEAPTKEQRAEAVRLFQKQTNLNLSKIVREIATPRDRADDEQDRRKAVEKLKREALQAHQQGKTDTAADLLLTAYRLERSGTHGDSLTLQTPSEKMLFVFYQSAPDAVHTALYLDGVADDEKEIVFPSGGLSVIAAPSSHGKTTTLISFALSHAVREQAKGDGRRVIFVTYEEPAANIIQKALSGFIGVPLSGGNFRTLKHYYKTTNPADRYKYFDSTSKTDTENFERAKDEFFTLCDDGYLQITYAAGTDSEELCNKISEWAANGDIAAVYVDYLQYMKPPREKQSNRREEEIKEICERLIDTAVETRLPIITAAQFNRSVTSPDKMIMQNIGEGGEIERKAAFILALYNNDMPMIVTKDNLAAVNELTGQPNNTVEDYSVKRTTPHTLSAVVLKNRHGEGARAGEHGLLSFNGNVGTVGNYTGTTGAAVQMPQTTNEDIKIAF